MKYVAALFLLISSLGFSQSSDEVAVKFTIDRFFSAFHAQDSVEIKKTVSNHVIMQTITADKAGKSMVKTEDFSKFLKNIVAIPKEKKFEEKLLSYHIQVDGNLASVWTPYQFWFGDIYSHCGANSFQLFKENNAWKIIYIIDTRRKEGCQ
ncbi:nuclear transport factor 2 family protein [Galbibacter pacificus]|uniref:Nuclear transport factor 2 family protein n=1 Tax=Galbibacter pacificus TaxID=2996052 RepID=A0ABT6FUN4_9FLAO|nr:nuclear transport factor 2 family protein [Galbibacter pacificus]MDG3583541.1 nuclear transport factor 2 family protein [Galbibacter pacificus]MDG3586983.1 nuclear transport factor 2 family protein [Galbibacter pacificus]